MRERHITANPGERDPLAELLDTAGVQAPGPKTLRVDQLFASRPAVLEAIKRAYARGVGYDRIARMVSKDGETVSGSAMRAWLSKEGVLR